MSEDLVYAKPDFTNKVCFEPGEKEERIVDIYASMDSLRIYDNPCVEGDTSTPPTTQDTVQQHPVTISSEEKKPIRAAAVSLGLLCLLLLAGIIGLLFYCSNIKTSCNAERDLLLKSFNNVTEERDQLRMTNDNVTRERNQLQTSYNLTKQLLTDLTLSFCQMKPSEKDRYSCYYISTEKRTWIESRHDCQSRGADLVTIKSKEEQDIVTSFKERAWIGLTDEVKEQTWKWVDGTQLTYKNWRDGQPNNVGSREDCAEVIGKSPKWNDSPCSKTNYWICEKSIVVGYI